MFGLFDNKPAIKCVNCRYDDSDKNGICKRCKYPALVKSNDPCKHFADSRHCVDKGDEFRYEKQGLWVYLADIATDVFILQDMRFCPFCGKELTKNDLKRWMDKEERIGEEVK